MVFTGLREEGGLALAEAMLSGAPVIVLAVGGARTIASSATDPARAVLIRPGNARETARGIGEAIATLTAHPPAATGPTLDQAAARRALRDAFDDALAAGARPGAAAPDSAPPSPAGIAT